MGHGDHSYQLFVIRVLSLGIFFRFDGSNLMALLRLISHYMVYLGSSFLPRPLLSSDVWGEPEWFVFFSRTSVKRVHIK